jgi:hypothetical protein
LLRKKGRFEDGNFLAQGCVYYSRRDKPSKDNFALRETSSLREFVQTGKQKREEDPQNTGHFDPHPVARKAAIACSLLLIIGF